MIATALLYIFLITISSLLSGLIYNKKNKKERIFFLILLASILAFFACFRGNAGSDTISYKAAYAGQNYFRWTDYEPGFKELMNIFRFFHFPFEFLLFFMNFFTSFFLFMAIDMEKEVIDPKIAVFTYMTIGSYFASYNVLRQGFACSISFYAMVLLIKKSSKKNIICAIFLMIVAGLFHYPSLICLLAIVVRAFIRNKKSKFFIATIIIATLFIVLNRNLLADLIFKITKNQYYVGYLTRQADSSANIFTYALKNCVVLLLGILFFSSYNKKPRFYTYFVLMIIGYILGSLSTVTNTQISRLGDYFTIFNVLILGFACKQYCVINNKEYNAIALNKVIVYGFCMTSFVYNYLVQGYGELVPYGNL